MKIQSIADVITNSSSELFVVRKEESFDDLISEIRRIVNNKDYRFYEYDTVDIYVAAEEEHDDLFNYDIWPGDLVIRTQENTLNSEGIYAVESELYGHNYFRRHLG